MLTGLERFREKVESRGGFESIRFSPHMRFRAGQRRIDWEGLKQKILEGEIEDVEENRNPNESIPYDKAYIVFISFENDIYSVPMYFLENGVIKCVTVMRE